MSNPTHPAEPGSLHISKERVKTSLAGRFNPIKQLTPERLAQQIDAFEQGRLRDLAILMDAVERRDIGIKTVVAKRKKAVARLPWEILTGSGDDEAGAAAHQEALEWAYNHLVATDTLNQNRRGGLRLLIHQLMDAQGKGFACHEVIWQPGIGGASAASPSHTLTARFRHVPLWWFENTTGILRFLPGEYSFEGVEMDPAGWLVSAGDALMIPTTVAYVFKQLPLRDWLVFCEKFGLPGVIGRTDAPPGTPQWTAMETAVGALVNDWAAVTNRGDEITLLETKGGGGTLPFPPIIEYMDRKIAALWRGADLSTISQGGAGSSGASLQGDESDLLLEDDAAWVEETLHEGFTKPVIRALFGVEEPLAYLKLITPQRRNIDADDKAVRLCLEAKIPLGIDATRERLGLPKPDDDDELLDASASPGGAGAQSPNNPDPAAPDPLEPDLANASEEEYAAAAHAEFARALAQDLAPFRARLDAILAIEDESTFRSRLTGFLADLESLKRDLTTDPASASALVEIQEAALLNGMARGAAGRQGKAPSALTPA